jgi:hypothetical protein
MSLFSNSSTSVTCQALEKLSVSCAVHTLVQYSPSFFTAFNLFLQGNSAFKLFETECHLGEKI